jgi:hypothetical protein
MAAATVAAMVAISAVATVVVMAAILAVATASATRILAAGTTVVEGSRDPIRSGTEVSPAITPLPGMAERISVKSETPAWDMATFAMR